MKINYVYCDSCVFLAYFKSEAGRVEIPNQLFEEIQKDKARKLITSVLSITEVSHAAEEKARHTLRSEFESILDEFWTDSSLLEFIEFHEPLARKARSTIRRAIEEGRSLRPADSIHLASAAFAGAGEFLTYDKKLLNWDAFSDLKIVEPYIAQPRLPNMD